MRLSLAVLTPGRSEGAVIPVAVSPFLVGRGPQCHLRPASPAVSQVHCALVLLDRQAWVCDLRSTNGTLVNGRPVEGQAELRPGDRLQVGLLDLLVRPGAGTPVDRPTPPPPAPGSRESAPVEEVAATLLLAMPGGAARPGGARAWTAGASRRGTPCSSRGRPAGVRRRSPRRRRRTPPRRPGRCWSDTCGGHAADGPPVGGAAGAGLRGGTARHPSLDGPSSGDLP
jgi:predicted component of type VI protein secretion system